MSPAPGYPGRDGLKNKQKQKQDAEAKAEADKSKSDGEKKPAEPVAKPPAGDAKSK